jgi:hypothetical protein
VHNWNQKNLENQMISWKRAQLLLAAEGAAALPLPSLPAEAEAVEDSAIGDTAAAATAAAAAAAAPSAPLGAASTTEGQGQVEASLGRGDGGGAPTVPRIEPTSFEAYILETMPENIRVKSTPRGGQVVAWLDERVEHDGWRGAFERLCATDELRDPGAMPGCESWGDGGGDDGGGGDNAGSGGAGRGVSPAAMSGCGNSGHSKAREAEIDASIAAEDAAIEAEALRAARQRAGKAQAELVAARLVRAAAAWELKATAHAAAAAAEVARAVADETLLARMGTGVERLAEYAEAAQNGARDLVSLLQARVAAAEAWAAKLLLPASKLGVAWGSASSPSSGGGGGGGGGGNSALLHALAEAQLAELSRVATSTDKLRRVLLGEVSEVAENGRRGGQRGDEGAGAGGFSSASSAAVRLDGGGSSITPLDADEEAKLPVCNMDGAIDAADPLGASAFGSGAAAVLSPLQHSLDAARRRAATAAGAWQLAEVAFECARKALVETAAAAQQQHEAAAVAGAGGRADGNEQGSSGGSGGSGGRTSPALGGRVSPVPPPGNGRGGSSSGAGSAAQPPCYWLALTRHQLAMAATREAWRGVAEVALAALAAFGELEARRTAALRHALRLVGGEFGLGSSLAPWPAEPKGADELGLRELLRALDQTDWLACRQAVAAAAAAVAGGERCGTLPNAGAAACEAWRGNLLALEVRAAPSMRAVAPAPGAVVQLLPLLPQQLAPAGLFKPCSPLNMALVAKHGKIRWLAPLGGIQGVLGIGSNWCALLLAAFALLCFALLLALHCQRCLPFSRISSCVCCLCFIPAT